MDISKLRAAWKQEEARAQIRGWDFSPIRGRFEEEHDLPWSYEETVREYLRPEAMLLDCDTGGGEFLFSLRHPAGRTAASEGYPPNARLCGERVLPGTEKPYPHMNLTEQRAAFEAAGFRILRAEEAYRPILFYNVGAFVWFARIIQWEFPDFSVDRCFQELLAMQEELERTGEIRGTIHRYLIAAGK